MTQLKDTKNPKFTVENTAWTIQLVYKTQRFIKAKV